MTEPTSRPGSGQRAGGGSDPEIVLAEALRAMAGGRAAPTATGATEHPVAPGLTAVQVLLIAAIVGLLVGAGVALLQLAG